MTSPNPAENESVFPRSRMAIEACLLISNARFADFAGSFESLKSPTSGRLITDGIPNHQVHSAPGAFGNHTVFLVSFEQLVDNRGTICKLARGVPFDRFRIGVDVVNTTLGLSGWMARCDDRAFHMYPVSKITRKWSLRSTQASEQGHARPEE